MPDIHGNVDGVRNSMLAEMKTLYDFVIPADQFMPQDLLRQLCGYSAFLNREIAIYLTRYGEVVDLLIGKSDHIDLPDLRMRRSDKRLSMVRCIHTHPNASGTLSDVDISALLSMRFDAICAVGVDEKGNPTTVQSAFLQPGKPGETQRSAVMPAQRLPDDA